MVSRPNHLRLVAARRGKIPATSEPAWGDVTLLAVLLVVNLVPLTCFALGVGRWSAGTLGFAAACALICGWELNIEARALLLRGRKEGSP